MDSPSGDALAPLREQLFRLMLSGDRRGALRHAMAAIDGVPLSELVLDVLAPVQTEIGLAWERGDIHHREEALATELADILLTVAASRTSPEPSGLKLLVCVADNEHHNLPARMVAELLRGEGHTVVFVGAPQPHPRFGELMTKVAPDAVVISCSLAMNLPGVASLAGLAHQVGLPVIVGGAGFAAAPARAASVGADAHAASIPEVGALTVAHRATVAAAFAPGPENTRQRDWSELVGRRRQIAAESAERLIWAAPGLIPRSLRAPKALAQRYGDLLQFVAAAALIDEEILVDYARWLIRRDHAAFGVDAAFTQAMLITLRDHLLSRIPSAAATVDVACAELTAPVGAAA